ncbi:BspA family leucine-rich repeat surface protein [Candidatus Saccharibacteria bacterium]|nr:BspA family leucine-rich repeat surface protein [Candidatus Saccharibacteria bacterium]
MQGQKSHSFKLFLWKNIFVVGAGFLTCFLGLSFSASDVSALFVPTLSASVDQANLQVNGNQVINSTDKTTEIPFNFTVNTNNRTGYTATLSAETENTALTNSSSTTGAKINSVSNILSLNNLPNNSWGYKFGASMNYAPIPALSTPAQILQTTGKTNGNESNQLSIGMKLADNLESGNYTNKLILSFVSNPYQMRAVMTNGPDFNTRVGNLDPNQAYYAQSPSDHIPTKPNIKSFKRSTVAPVSSISTINIEDSDMSDYEIKAWYNTADQAVYYYTEPNVVFLNENSEAMFRWFTKMETIDLSSFNTSEVTTMNTMFYMMNSLKSIDVSGFNTSKVTDMNAMFDLTGVIEQLDVSNFDTSNVTDMKWMFFGLNKLKKLNLTNFDTSRVTNMYGMFDAMTDVSEIKFGTNFNTRNVTNMGRMFSRTSSIQQLDLSHFNTGNVTAMNDMFSLMTSLTQINFGANFDTSNVTDMTGMFYQSTSLVNLDLSHFNTRKVKSMISMFSQMSGLTILDISNFETPSLENAGSMFAIDPGFSDNLEKIYVNQDFDTSKLTSSTNAFIRRNRLRGGNGSYLSDPVTADKTWLRVDRPGVQGYFTRKS